MALERVAWEARRTRREFRELLQAGGRLCPRWSPGSSRPGARAIGPEFLSEAARLVDRPQRAWFLPWPFSSPHPAEVFPPSQPFYPARAARGLPFSPARE